MKILHITLLCLVIVVFANGGKVNWDSKGKPQIEKPSKPVKGCQQQSLEDLAGDKKDSTDKPKCSK